MISIIFVGPPALRKYILSMHVQHTQLLDKTVAADSCNNAVLIGGYSVYKSVGAS